LSATHPNTFTQTVIYQYIYIYINMRCMCIIDKLNSVYYMKLYVIWLMPVFKMTIRNDLPLPNYSSPSLSTFGTMWSYIREVTIYIISCTIIQCLRTIQWIETKNLQRIETRNLLFRSRSYSLYCWCTDLMGVPRGTSSVRKSSRVFGRSSTGCAPISRSRLWMF